MMQAVENRFGPDGKPPKPIEWLTDNGSCYTKLRPGALPSNWDSSR
jgi:transposase InsO family protein